MHEMAITQELLKVVLRHAELNGATRVISISLRIGELRDIVDEWLQRFFDYLSRKTIAEGAKLEIERSPIVMQCKCGERFPVSTEEIRKDSEMNCPRCGGGSVVLFGGREFDIQSIEVI